MRRLCTAFSHKNSMNESMADDGETDHDDGGADHDLLTALAPDVRARTIVIDTVSCTHCLPPRLSTIASSLNVLGTGKLLAILHPTLDATTLARVLPPSHALEMTSFRRDASLSILLAIQRGHRTKGGGPLAVSRASVDDPQDVARAAKCILGLAAAADGLADDNGSEQADRPPWALSDASGQRLLDVSVRCADGTALVVVPRGSSLPAYGEVLLTSSSHGADMLILELLLGVRVTASGCRTLNSALRLSLEDLRPRGLAQVRLEVGLSTERLVARACDMHTGVVCHVVLETAGLDADAQDGARPSALPLPWRYENPYADEPHPGFCCAGGRFIRVLREPTQSTDSSQARRLDAAGEVAPETTAARVWPGAHLLATYLHEPTVTEHVLNGASRVIELGAGSGVPGLALWTLGAREVILTDLEENLHRLHATIQLNGAARAVQAVALDWMQPLPPDIRGGAPFDVILAADCVFWRGLFEPLCATLCALAAVGRTDELADAPPPLVLLTVTARLDRAEAFVAIARQHGWVVEEVAVQGAAAMMASTHTRLLRLTLVA